MYHKKNYRWIWIAVDRYVKRFVSFVCGDRSTAIGLKLLENIKEVNIRIFLSDYWKCYKEFLPSEKHLQTKEETYTVEGYNSKVRHYLARLKMLQQSRVYDCNFAKFALSEIE